MCIIITGLFPAHALQSCNDFCKILPASFLPSCHHEKSTTMLLCTFLIFTSAFILFTNGTLKPGDVEPGWLTLRTSEQASQKGQGQIDETPAGNPLNTQISGVPKAIPRDTAGSTHPIENLHSTRTTRYFKSSDTRAKIRASWTKERRQKYGQTMKMVNKGRKHTLQARENMRKSHENKTKTPAHKQNLSDALIKVHALKKENKNKDT